LYAKSTIKGQKLVKRRLLLKRLTKSVLLQNVSYIHGEILLHRKLFLSSTLLFVLFTFSLVTSVEAQSSSMWIRTYGGTGDDWAYSLITTSDGGYAVAGSTQPSLSEPEDFWLIKMDWAGYMEWNKTYGGANLDIAHSLVATSDGGYALAGYTNSFDGENIDFLLVKTDEFGSMEWNQTYGGTGSEWCRSLVATSDGGYALAGETVSFGAGSSDFWLVKTDALGNREWNRTYGGTEYEEVGSLVETSDGGYAIVGSTLSFGAGLGDFWLIKTDALGNMEWNKTYGGTGYEWAYSLVETSDGGYVLVGSTESFGAGREDFWLVKTDEFGNMEWGKTYGGREAEWCFSMVATSDGGYALAGWTRSFGAGNEDVWLIKTDESGNKEWDWAYGGTESEWARSLVETSDGGYALAGGTKPFGAGYEDFWLVKSDENGVIPEGNSWIILSLFLTAIMFALINKKRLL